MDGINVGSLLSDKYCKSDSDKKLVCVAGRFLSIKAMAHVAELN